MTFALFERKTCRTLNTLPVLVPIFPLSDPVQSHLLLPFLPSRPFLPLLPHPQSLIQEMGKRC